MIEYMNEDQEEDNEVQTNAHLKVEWYKIHTESTFCKVWDFLIALVTIYSMFVTPYILIFPDIYNTCPCFGDDVCTPDPAYPSKTYLVTIELAIDIIYIFEILLNFVKVTKTRTEI